LTKNLIVRTVDVVKLAAVHTLVNTPDALELQPKCEDYVAKWNK
jgi:hypothetical protein